MAHHGWVHVLDSKAITPDSLKSPFGRMFAAQNHQYNSHAVSLLAGSNGPMHAPANPKPKTDDPAPTDGDKTKKGNPAGFTFLGQFIDHDLTEFRVIGGDFELIPQNPTIGQRQLLLEDTRRLNKTDRPTTTNGRTGKPDLDSVYGLLGTAQPDLFDSKGCFVLAKDGSHDLERGEGYRHNRLIADPRNDENKLIVQVHILFERLHNKVHTAASAGVTVPANTGPTTALFLQSKQKVVDAYQRILLHDYLPRIVQETHIEAVLKRLSQGKTRYQAMNARNRDIMRGLGLSAHDAYGATAMPVEFSHAVFRLGHSQLLNGYCLQRTAPVVPLFAPGGDLRGDASLANYHVSWDLFFKTGDQSPQHGQPIDGLLPASIFRLPPPTIGEPPVSLAERNIRRGVDFGLPSGQQAASEFAADYGYIEAVPTRSLFPDVAFRNPALSPSEQQAPFDDVYPEVLKREPALRWDTPLWYYILREAEQFTAGPQLGSVGGLIVAETILGSLVEYKIEASFGQGGIKSSDALREKIAAKVEELSKQPCPDHAALEYEAAAALWAEALPGVVADIVKSREDVKVKPGEDFDAKVYDLGPPASVDDIFTMAQLVRFL